MRTLGLMVIAMGILRLRLDRFDLSRDTVRCISLRIASASASCFGFRGEILVIFLISGLEASVVLIRSYTRVFLLLEASHGG